MKNSHTYVIEDFISQDLMDDYLPMLMVWYDYCMTIFWMKCINCGHYVSFRHV